jgi:glyoxylase-like metal-dependent hydrolase (beta-lactamase superfamily II)/imidazolonepropionase-like amidohydrolase
VVPALLFAMALLHPQSPQPTTALVNGNWFHAGGFRPDTFYAVGPTLTRRRPMRVDTVIDLAGGYVVPAAGDAHQHLFNDPEKIAGETRRFLRDGVFYVMVQDAIIEPGPEVLRHVNTPAGVDVAYTRVPLLASTHGLPQFFERLAAQGMFGSRRTARELDGHAFVVIDTRADLAAKWPAVLRANPDFIKVILAFSEDLPRRRSPAFLADSAHTMARPGLDPALLEPIVARAHAAGRRVSVHVETAQDFAVAVRAGADLIAHLPGWHLGPTAGFADTSLAHWFIRNEDAARAARQGTTVITTLLPKPFFDNERLRDRFARVQRENLSLLHRHGVPIALGADGDETALGELRVIRRLGVFDNATLLRMLVETTPRTIFPSRRIGRLDEGYEANLLVLGGDPLADLEHLSDVRLRMKQGRLLPGQEVDSTSFSATPVAGPIHFLQAGRGPTFDNAVASIGHDGTLLVDAAYAETADSLLAALARAGGSGPRILINTHYHHAGGNAELGRGSVIVGHGNTRRRMRQPSRMYGMMPIGPWPDSALPAVAVDTALTLHFNGEEIRLIHFPRAHTDGDLAVFFTGSRVVATGDLYVPMLGVCDWPNGCHWEDYVSGFRRLAALVPSDAVILPGHGPPSTAAELREFAGLLEDVTGRVRRAMAAGRSREQVLAEGLPDRYAAWARRGIPADFFLGNAYDAMLAGAGSK